MIGLPTTIFGVITVVILAMNGIFINSTLWWAIMLLFWGSNFLSIILTDTLHKDK